MRVLILEKISEKPCCLAELASVTGKNESTISKHVSILKEAGCLVGDRKGRHVFCHMPNPQLARVWEITDRCIRERLRRSGHPQARGADRAP